MNASQYKAYHESFMRNNNGSSPFHTFSCIFLTVNCTIIASILNSCKYTLSLIEEYAIIVLPMIFTHTVLAEWIFEINTLILFVMVLVWIQNRNYAQTRLNLDEFNLQKDRRISSISIMRGLTYLITIFAILSVDFQCFPRHLAKTERYGYSLMDTGVGLFILMSGIVHKNNHRQEFIVFLKENVQVICLMFVLGFARLLSVKQLDYQEHVSEYGVHWNFFFTLATVKLLVCFLSYCCDLSKNYLMYSMLVLLLHEFLLTIVLEDYVFSTQPRNSIISANKEGLTSLLGYLSMYLFAAHIKTVLTRVDRRYFVIKDLVVTLICCSVFGWVSNIFRPTSRTLANAGYCFYIESVLISFTIILYLTEISFQSTETKFHIPFIVKIMNQNGLVLFLKANLLTGAINILIRTMLVQNIYALLIINSHMICIILTGAIISKDQLINSMLQRLR